MIRKIASKLLNWYDKKMRYFRSQLKLIPVEEKNNEKIWNLNRSSIYNLRYTYTKYYFTSWKLKAYAEVICISPSHNFFTVSQNQTNLTGRLTEPILSKLPNIFVQNTTTSSSHNLLNCIFSWMLCIKSKVWNNFTSEPQKITRPPLYC